MAMTLSLKTVRRPAGVGSDHRDVAQGPFSIGRGTESDWVLPDPEKVLSKRHCRLSTKGESWFITDVSANGTFLNESALDPDLPHPLRDRDRLSLGQYEMEVRIGESFDDEDASEAPTRFAIHTDTADQSRLTSDPFGPAQDRDSGAPHPSIGLPQDFDGLSDDERLDAHPYAERDDTPDMQSQFRPPRPSLDLIPEGWDEDEAQAGAPASPPAPPTPPTPPAASKPRDTSAVDEETFEPTERRAPAAAVASKPFGDAAPPARVAPAPSSRGAGLEGFAAFAFGAGYEGPPPKDRNEALRSLGAAFRAMVSGLRQSMIARATVKTEFRIDQTMIRAAGNNPIKFAADDDDALAALIGGHRQSGIDARDSVAEAMRDIAMHELAVAAAMQSAVRDLLAELEPDKIMRSVRRTKLDELIGTRKQGAWDAYVERHAEITHALADEFDSIFGKSFARAYQNALRETAADKGDEL